MATYQVRASALIDAPSERVYGIIADYRNGHPRILPKRYFKGLEVEQGGVGAGTVIRFQMRVIGTTQTLRAAVTEPQPGHVLVETDLDRGTVTTFTVASDAAGRGARVTITTDLTARDGLLGSLERYLISSLLQRAYAEELKQLESVSRER